MIFQVIAAISMGIGIHGSAEDSEILAPNTGLHIEKIGKIAAVDQEVLISVIVRLPNATKLLDIQKYNSFNNIKNSCDMERK